VLFLLKVDQEVIDEDYRLSEPELASEKEERLKEIGSIGLSEQFAVCPPDVVKNVLFHIQDKWGSVEKYLENAGVDKEKVDFIRRKLQADAS
jgi:protein-tyrosine phosphatase